MFRPSSTRTLSCWQPEAVHHGNEKLSHVLCLTCSSPWPFLTSDHTMGPCWFKMCEAFVCMSTLHVSHLLYKTQVSRISASDSQTEDWCEKCLNWNSTVFELHNSFSYALLFFPARIWRFFQKANDVYLEVLQNSLSSSAVLLYVLNIKGSVLYSLKS